jgi:hypothetical protein
MKKYLVGVFAIVLAFSLSAFTNQRSNSKPQKMDVLYYYWTDGTTLGSAIGEFDPVIDRAQILSESGCEDETQTVCARGFDSPSPTSPSDPHSDEITTSSPRP